MSAGTGTPGGQGYSFIIWTTGEETDYQDGLSWAFQPASTIDKATVTAADVRAAAASGATTITLGPRVKKIKKGAFKGTRVKTVMVKSTRLTKKYVKGCFKGSKVKTVKVPKAKRKAYRKAFAKANCGRKVKVK